MTLNTSICDYSVRIKILFTDQTLRTVSFKMIKNMIPRHLHQEGYINNKKKTLKIFRQAT